MLSGHGQDRGSLGASYHFYPAYGSHEEILDHHTNKLNQDLDKAQDLMVKPTEDLFFTLYANEVVFILVYS